MPPARERRLLLRVGHTGHIISIHAPARERQEYSLAGIRLFDFNPRSRKGATADGEEEPVAEGISIHAPARERQER